MLVGGECWWCCCWWWWCCSTDIVSFGHRVRLFCFAAPSEEGGPSPKRSRWRTGGCGGRTPRGKRGKGGQRASSLLSLFSACLPFLLFSVWFAVHRCLDELGKKKRLRQRQSSLFPREEMVAQLQNKYIIIPCSTRRFLGHVSKRHLSVGKVSLL